jgi:hypothetical protein
MTRRRLFLAAVVTAMGLIVVFVVWTLTPEPSSLPSYWWLPGWLGI